MSKAVKSLKKLSASTIKAIEASIKAQEAHTRMLKKIAKLVRQCNELDKKRLSPETPFIVEAFQEALKASDRK